MLKVALHQRLSDVAEKACCRMKECGRATILLEDFFDGVLHGDCRSRNEVRRSFSQQACMETRRTKVSKRAIRHYSKTAGAVRVRTEVIKNGILMLHIIVVSLMRRCGFGADAENRIRINRSDMQGALRRPLPERLGTTVFGG